MKKLLSFILLLLLTLPVSLADPIQFGVLGDSIANNHLTGFSNRTAQAAWPTWAVYLSGGRLHMRKNAAVPGAVTSDVLISQTPKVIAAYCEYAPVYVGVNDVNIIAGGIGSFGQSLSNLNAVVLELKARQRVPILCGLAPHRYGQFEVTDRWNTEVRNLAALRNVPFVDFWPDCAEPGTNIWKVGYDRGDFVHPNQKGAKLMAEVFLRSMRWEGSTNYQSPFLAQSTWDTNNVITNGIFLDRNSDLLPDEWTLHAENCESVTLLKDDSVRGNWAVMAKTGLSGTCSLSNNISWSGFSAGDRLLFAGRVWTDGLIASTNGGLVIGARFAGGIDPNSDPEFAPVFFVTNDLPRHSVFSFEGFAVAGATNAEITVRMVNMSGVVRVAQLKLVNLSRLQQYSEPNLQIYSRGGGIDIPHSGSVRVGINTTNPAQSYGLDVNSGAHFKAITVP